jgi:hypothetical protein
MLAEGEGKEVATCGGWSRVLRRKNSVWRVSAAAAVLLKVMVSLWLIN